jgi:membrane fusion protein, multidrug efflux system
VSKKPFIIAVFLIGVASAVAYGWYRGLGVETTDDATIEAHTIPISAKVSGYLTKLNVQDNGAVKKEAILAEIDPRDYELRRDAAAANYAAALATFNNAALNARRQISLGKAVTQKDIDNAITAQASAQAMLDNAKAQLAIAEKDLADTKVIAPEDGTVTMRTAEQGGYYPAGKQLFILVGKERWVSANFKEVQIGKFTAGQKVDIIVDTYPDLKFHGHVDSIQSGTGAHFSAFPPENATGNFVKIVQRVPVKILIDTVIPDHVILGAGMSVRPTIHTDEKIPQ